MTKIAKRIVKCIKCGEESEQLIVYSVNFSFGSEEENEKLVNHIQKCPKCGYQAPDISKKENSYE